MKFKLHPSKTPPPPAVVQPEAPVETPPAIPSLESPLPYSKLQMQWTVVEGKLVCEWQQNPD